jgi:hypothetical protein
LAYLDQGFAAAVDVALEPRSTLAGFGAGQTVALRESQEGNMSRGQGDKIQYHCRYSIAASYGLCDDEESEEPAAATAVAAAAAEPVAAVVPEVELLEVD